jgi:hypothetical protein
MAVDTFHGALLFSRENLLEKKEREHPLPIKHKDSQMGCGWNILWILGYISLEEAQQKVVELVENNEMDEEGFSGLQVSTIIHVIQTVDPVLKEEPIVTINTLFPRPELRSRENMEPLFQQFIEDALHSRANASAIGSPYLYIIVKFLIEEDTGLGHTILIELKKDTENYIITCFDVQKNRYTPLHEYIDYLCSQYGRIYNSMAVIGVETKDDRKHLGGTKKRKKKKRKTIYRKNKKHGGKSLFKIYDTKDVRNADPEMIGLNKKDVMKLEKAIEQEDTYFNLLESKNI